MTRNETIERLQQRIRRLMETLERVHRSEGKILNDLIKYQKRLDRVLKSGKRSSQNTGEKNIDVNTELVQGFFERPYNNAITPRIQHKVRILNPNPSRNERGTIVGFCKNGRVKIDTGDNLPPLIRSKQNIKKSVQGCINRNSIGKSTPNSSQTFVPA